MCIVRVKKTSLLQSKAQNTASENFIMEKYMLQFDLASNKQIPEFSST